MQKINTHLEDICGHINKKKTKKISMSTSKKNWGGVLSKSRKNATFGVWQKFLAKFPKIVWMNTNLGHIDDQLSCFWIWANRKKSYDHLKSVNHEPWKILFTSPPPSRAPLKVNVCGSQLFSMNIHLKRFGVKLKTKSPPPPPVNVVWVLKNLNYIVF